MTNHLSRRIALVLLFIATCALAGSAGAALTVSPTSLTFGNTAVGSSTTLQVTIAESSSVATQLDGVGFQSGLDFSASLEVHYLVDGELVSVESNPSLPVFLFRVIDPELGTIEQQRAVVKVTFSPETAGPKSDQLVIDLAPTSDRIVTLGGVATSPPSPIPSLPPLGLLLLGAGLACTGPLALRRDR